jgi:translation initiation factor 2 subunit 2
MSAVEIVGYDSVKDLNTPTNKFYDIEYMLDRAYGSIIMNKEKLKVIMPILIKKDRKTYIINFYDVCKSIGRSTDDIKGYISRELQMDTSIKENGCLKIDGIVKVISRVENIIKGYIVDYIMCSFCKSCKTTTQKENRINYLLCDTCKSKRALNIVKVLTPTV